MNENKRRIIIEHKDSSETRIILSREIEQTKLEDISFLLNIVSSLKYDRDTISAQTVFPLPLLEC